MAEEAASTVIQTAAALPYVGPVCATIQNILEIIKLHEQVRQGCTEEIPRELYTMKITLSLLPESIGFLTGDAKLLCDTRLDQLGRHLEGMKQIVTACTGKQNVITKALSAKSNKARIDELWEALATAKQDVILLLTIFNGARLDALRQSAARLYHDMLEVNKLVRHVQLHSTTTLKNELEREYVEIMWPCMERLEGYQERMGSRYATAMIVPPLLVTPDERAEIFKHMRTLAAYWRNIQQYHRCGTDILRRDKCWAGRGAAYRMLVEPLDIVNWYFRRKNVHSGHYIDDIPEDNELFDNCKRPSRYILLQQKEADIFDTKPMTSLRTARELRVLLNGKSWETYA